MPELHELARTSKPASIPPKPLGDSGKGSISAEEVSVPVGVTEEGQPIFAHVRFDAPLKKGMLASLKQLLEALEKNLA